jgi:hypothetical protein
MEFLLYYLLGVIVAIFVTKTGNYCLPKNPAPMTVVYLSIALSWLGCFIYTIAWVLVYLSTSSLGAKIADFFHTKD